MVQVSILNRCRLEHRCSSAYGAAYSTWFNTWEAEYRRLDPSKGLRSDHFSRQDEVLTVWWKGECVGLTLFSVLSLKSECGRNDSAFEPWPHRFVDELSTQYAAILVCSAMAVSSPFRGKVLEGSSAKDWLAAASIQHFAAGPFEIMMANTRNERRVNGLVYQMGAELVQTVNYFGEPSDLVVFRKDRLKFFNADLERQIANRIVAPEILEIKNAEIEFEQKNVA